MTPSEKRARRLRAIVERAYDAVDERELLPAAAARVIAMDWQSGQGSLLYAFGSCGVVEDPEELVHEIELNYAGNAQDDVDVYRNKQLAVLVDYVERTGVRGPVKGWAELWVN